MNVIWIILTVVACLCSAVSAWRLLVLRRHLKKMSSLFCDAKFRLQWTAINAGYVDVDGNVLCEVQWKKVALMIDQLQEFDEKTWRIVTWPF